MNNAIYDKKLRTQIDREEYFNLKKTSLVRGVEFVAVPQRHYLGYNGYKFYILNSVKEKIDLHKKLSVKLEDKKTETKRVKI